MGQSEKIKFSMKLFVLQSEVNMIDGSGPAPTDFHEKMEWEARRKGIPPELI
jgi:hypothetical protein